MQVGDQDDESKRCTFENCPQVDFLASRCGYCGAMFCVNHTSAEAHKCKAFGTQSVICPVCELHVPMDVLDQLPDDAISRHLDNYCRLRNRTVQPGGPHCCVKGCTSISSFIVRCDDCQKLYCILHRAPARHNCSVASPRREAVSAAVAKEEKRHNAKNKGSIYKAQKEGEKSLCIPRNTPGTALGKATDDPHDSVTLLVTLAKELKVSPFFMIFPRNVVVGRVLDSIVSQAALDSAQVAAMPGTWAIYSFRRSARTGDGRGPGALMEMSLMKPLQNFHIENGSVVFLGKKEMMTAQVTQEVCAYLQRMKTGFGKDKKKGTCNFI